MSDTPIDKKINHNIAYLTFGESLLSNLFRRQVIDIIVHLRKQLDVDKYYLISFLPWHQCLRERVKTKDAINSLKLNGINCKVLPNPFLLPVYSFKDGWKMRSIYNLFTIPLIVLYILPVIIYLQVFCKVKLYHCRSYMISIPALINKLIFPKLIFVFDPRSDYPEERALQENWDRSNINFRFWKYIEKNILKYADAVIAIGERFDKHMQNIYKDVRSRIIHNNVAMNKFVFNEEFRRHYRKMKNINGRIVFCYSGTLKKKYWNDPETYARFIAQYSPLFEFDFVFLFLIPEYCREALINALRKYNINLISCVIESPLFEDMPKYLSIADIGIYFLPYYSPRVGTKVVEYCSIGLPIIVNENVGGATELINKYKLGVSLENDTITDHNNEEIIFKVAIINKLINEKANYRERCREFAHNNVDIEIVSEQYSSLYSKILLK